MQPREHRLGREAAALALIAEIFRRQAVRGGAEAGELHRLADDLDHIAAAVIVPARPGAGGSVGLQGSTG
jgi:hypothetical protein